MGLGGPVLQEEEGEEGGGQEGGQGGGGGGGGLRRLRGVPGLLLRPLRPRAHLRAHAVVLAVALYQGSGHPVQESLGETRRVLATGVVHHLLAAVQVLLETAAQNLHIVLLLPPGHRPPPPPPPPVAPTLQI